MSAKKNQNRSNSLSPSSMVLDIFGVIAIWIFVSGGILFRSLYLDRNIVLEIADYGWFFLPLCIAFLFKGRTAAKQSLVISALKVVWKDLLARSRASRPKQCLFVCSILAVLTFCHIAGTWNRYLSFKGDWDLAIYANACANGLFSSLRYDRSILGDHFEPLLFLLTPLCQVFDAVPALLVIQSITFGIGGVGIFFLARSLRWSFPSSLVLSIFYILFPGNMSSILHDFHMITFALGILPWLFFAFCTHRLVLFTLLALCYCGLKETASLTIAGFGALFLFRAVFSRQTSNQKLEKNWITGGAGIFFVLFSLGLFLFVMHVALPFFRNGEQSMYIEKQFGHLGKSIPEILINLATNPLLFFKTTMTLAKLKYVFFLFLPFLFIPLLSPALLLPALPALLINLLSNDPSMYRGGFHYQSEIFPVLFVATMFALQKSPTLFQNRFSRRNNLRFPPKNFTPLRLVWLLWFLVAWSGRAPLWYPSFYRPDLVHITMHKDLLTMRDQYKDKKVSAIEKVVTHLAPIRNLYLLDRWKEADVIIIGYPREKHLWHFPYEKVEQEIIPQAEMSGFVKVFEHPIYRSFRVWERSGQ